MTPSSPSINERSIVFQPLDFYLKVNLVVSGITGPTTPELGLISNAWSCDSDLRSTYVPAWTMTSAKSSAGNRSGGGGGAGNAGGGLRTDALLRDEELWDSSVNERLEQMLGEAKRQAEAAAAKSAQEALEAARLEAQVGGAAEGGGEDGVGGADVGAGGAGKRKGDEVLMDDDDDAVKGVCVCVMEWMHTMHFVDCAGGQNCTRTAYAI